MFTLKFIEVDSYTPGPGFKRAFSSKPTNEELTTEVLNFQETAKKASRWDLPALDLTKPICLWYDILYRPDGSIWYKVIFFQAKTQEELTNYLSKNKKYD